MFIEMTLGEKNSDPLLPLWLILFIVLFSTESGPQSWIELNRLFESWKETEK